MDAIDGEVYRYVPFQAAAYRYLLQRPGDLGVESKEVHDGPSLLRAPRMLPQQGGRGLDFVRPDLLGDSLEGELLLLLASRTCSVASSRFISILPYGNLVDEHKKVNYAPIRWRPLPPFPSLAPYSVEDHPKCRNIGSW